MELVVMPVILAFSVWMVVVILRLREIAFARRTVIPAFTRFARWWFRWITQSSEWAIAKSIALVAKTACECSATQQATQ